ncbi:MAG: hypothetical protein KatS3mg009_1089 [Acidimicrobiia bacterium]|nr:MAG: hypothetical protein KatS3mg009_1089 [Acidimicrobiia bacterium]
MTSPPTAGTRSPDDQIRPTEPCDEPLHALDAARVAERLHVDPSAGLTPDEVLRRRARHGTNALPKPAPRPRILLFLDQFRSLLVAVLVGAGVLAALIGDVKDVVVIAVVVLANAVLGFVQEHRAESSVAALERMVEARARVRRDGVVSVVPAEDLVPGDVVVLEAGDRVPADGRWTVAVDLEVDESAFTGESAPVRKRVDPPDPGRRTTRGPGLDGPHEHRGHPRSRRAAGHRDRSSHRGRPTRRDARAHGTGGDPAAARDRLARAPPDARRGGGRDAGVRTRVPSIHIRRGQAAQRGRARRRGDPGGAPRSPDRDARRGDPPAREAARDREAPGLGRDARRDDGDLHRQDRAP